MMDLRFPPTSRYHGIETAVFVDSNGVERVYLLRRFVPPPERFALLLEHRVKAHERLDNVTAEHLDDPEQFWRIADANRAMRPEALTEREGRLLRITLAEGIPGMPHA
jgi:hypothetical protein